ncbi:MAG: universal stress protein [Burkholderiaceae bacterium]
MFRNILVPTDGSAASVAGALSAVPLAKLASATITVVYVQDIYPYTGIGQSNATGLNNFMAAERAQGARAFEQISDKAKLAGVVINTLIAEDSQAARGIVTTAQSCGADLIVMGSHGRSGVAKLVLGSVATKVLELSTVPVLIVKSPSGAGQSLFTLRHGARKHVTHDASYANQ